MRAGWPGSRRTQALLAQSGAVLLMAATAALLLSTLSGNLARLNLSVGFGFLLRPAGMAIGESVVPFDPSDSFAWAMFAAGLNTLRVSAAAILGASILGTLVGVMRLNGNPLLRAITSVYVELFRNTPLLLQILFWSALVLKLPSVRQAISLDGWAYLSQRGLQLPAPVSHGSFSPAAAATALGCAAAAALLVRGVGRRALAFLAAGAAAWLLGLFATGTLAFEWPARTLFGYSGGLNLTPEFCALLAGLVAYTGAFIAEIVRGGILSIPAGQWEAARSLGLRDRHVLRLVVMPQAVRVILPAITSQYVGIIKNSSLAIAIGFPDLFWSMSTAINVTGHAIEGVAAMMAAYLVLTLGTAGAMNTWHARLLHRGTAR